MYFVVGGAGIKVESAAKVLQTLATVENKQPVVCGNYRSQTGEKVPQTRQLGLNS